MKKKTKAKADEPIRVLQIFAGLDSGGVSNYVMNLYREMDTDKIQFDFAMTAGEKSLYDEEVLERGGRIFYFDTDKSLIANLRVILREQGPFSCRSQPCLLLHRTDPGAGSESSCTDTDLACP